MSRILKQLKEELGWQGMSGIALLLLAAAFMNFALNPLEQKTALMRSQLEAARANSGKVAKAFDTGVHKQDLSAFFDALPEEKDVTDTLASIQNAAGRAGVELKQAEYHLDGKDGPRVEYGMNFPAKGEYPRIRAFLSRVLADNPALALDQVNFQRDKISDTTLNASIRMTLFLKPSK
jgi:Tfp pilus assembly protein PilO